MINRVDYVVPMVFPSDPLWREDYKRIKGYDDNMQTDVRYRSWNTERLLVCCVRKFMPFVRNIIVLLARESQCQEWMKEILVEQQTMEGPKLRIVYHEDFMPADKLPTFNSRAIEMYLHRIPGLSERFLYGNDDMIPLSPLQESDFFIGSLPCLHMTDKPFRSPKNQFDYAILGGINFVGTKFGKTFKESWLHAGHTIVPICKETCEHLWECYGDEIAASVTRFRDVSNFNQYIYIWYQFLTGQYVDRVPNRQYCSVKGGIQAIADVITSPDAGIVCINDNEVVGDIDLYASVVREGIELKLQL